MNIDVGVKAVGVVRPEVSVCGGRDVVIYGSDLLDASLFTVECISVVVRSLGQMFQFLDGSPEFLQKYFSGAEL